MESFRKIPNFAQLLTPSEIQKLVITPYRITIRGVQIGRGKQNHEDLERLAEEVGYSMTIAKRNELFNKFPLLIKELVRLYEQKSAEDSEDNLDDKIYAIREKFLLTYISHIGFDGSKKNTYFSRYVPAKLGMKLEREDFIVAENESMGIRQFRFLDEATQDVFEECCLDIGGSDIKSRKRLYTACLDSIRTCSERWTTRPRGIPPPEVVPLAMGATELDAVDPFIQDAVKNVQVPRDALGQPYLASYVIDASKLQDGPISAWEQFLNRCDRPTEFCLAIADILLPEVRSRVLTILKGNGGDGKSVIMSVIQEALGPEICVPDELETFSDSGKSRFMGERLRSAALIILNEGEESGSYILQNGAIKSFLGADARDGEIKGGRRFFFIPRARMFMTTNRPVWISIAQYSELSRLNLIQVTRRPTQAEMSQFSNWQGTLSEQLPAFLLHCLKLRVHYLGSLNANYEQCEAYTRSQMTSAVGNCMNEFEAQVASFISDHYIYDNTIEGKPASEVLADIGMDFREQFPDTLLSVKFGMKKEDCSRRRKITIERYIEGCLLDKFNKFDLRIRKRTEDKLMRIVDDDGRETPRYSEGPCEFLTLYKKATDVAKSSVGRLGHPHSNSRNCSAYLPFITPDEFRSQQKKNKNHASHKLEDIGEFE